MSSVDLAFDSLFKCVDGPMRDIHGRGGFALLAAASVSLATVELSGAPVPTLLMKAQAAVAQPAPAAAADASRETLKRYCATCHNSAANTAATQSGVVLDKVDCIRGRRTSGALGEVLRRLHAGTMPPQGARHPSVADVHALTAYLESALDQRRRCTRNPGRPLLHRLNRAEYAQRHSRSAGARRRRRVAAAGRRLGYGFDNIADVLGVSPALLERYLSAAETISALAVGDPAIGRPARRPTASARTSRRISTSKACRSARVGGIWSRPHVPARRRVRLQGRAVPDQPRNDARPRVSAPGRVHGRRRSACISPRSAATQDLTAAFEQADATTADAVDARLRVRVPVKAGPHAIARRVRRRRAARRHAAAAAVPPQLGRHARLRPGVPHIETLTITGPFNADRPRRHAEPPPDLRLPSGGARAGDDAVRRRDPLDAGAPRVSAAGRRGATCAPLLEFYETGRTRGQRSTPASSWRCSASSPARSSCSASSAIRRASPPARVYRVSDLELGVAPVVLPLEQHPGRRAAELAGEGRLHEPGGARARRCGGCSPIRESHALVEQLRRPVAAAAQPARRCSPNSDEFPDFDDNLRQAFQRETELFFESIIREDRSVLDLLTADYTFVNERLAQHYGIPTSTAASSAA